MSVTVPFPLKAPAVIAVCVIGFLAFAAMASGGPNETDQALLLALREPGDLTNPLGPPWVEEAARDITALGGTPLLLLATFGAALHLWLNGNRRLAIFAIVTILGAQIASELLKSVFDRPRPDLVQHETAVYSASFPSGHAMLSAAALFTLAFVSARALGRTRNRVFLYATAAALVFLIGASRVYLGVHWPTDVVAGWFAGIAWAAAAAWIYRSFVAREH